MSEKDLNEYLKWVDFLKKQNKALLKIVKSTKKFFQRVGKYEQVNEIDRILKGEFDERKN